MCWLANYGLKWFWWCRAIKIIIGHQIEQWDSVCFPKNHYCKKGWRWGFLKIRVIPVPIGTHQWGLNEKVSFLSWRLLVEKQKLNCFQLEYCCPSHLLTGCVAQPMIWLLQTLSLTLYFFGIQLAVVEDVDTRCWSVSGTCTNVTSLQEVDQVMEEANEFLLWSTVCMG